MTFWISVILATAALTTLEQALLPKLLVYNEAVLAEWGYDKNIKICGIPVLALGNLVLLVFGWLGPSTLPLKLFSCFFLTLNYLILLIDFRCQFIFDITVAMLVAGTICATPWLPVGLLERLGAAVAAFVVMFVLSLLGRGALGGGDVKLMAAFGLAFGLKALPMIAAVGFILGGIGAIAMLLFKKAGKRDFFAFGPFLIIGMYVYWLSSFLH